MNFDDDTYDGPIQDLSLLRTKNKKRCRRKARKLKCLHEKMTAERKEHSEKLALKTLVTTITYNTR